VAVCRLQQQAEQEPQRVGPPGGELAIEIDQGFELGRRGRLLQDLRAGLHLPVAHRLVDHGEEQILLVLEVPEDRALAGVGLLGEPLSAAHPNLEGLTDLVFEELPPKAAAKGMDVVLLGLPHKVAAQKVPEILDTGARIVDLSGDFRLTDPVAYERYYGAPHP